MGESMSGRLADLVAHSGAVVLLQSSSHVYHFSARLKPWVHFVPVAHSLSDIIEKVEWLVQHDDLARQIAQNAENFGKSYLRLEDYFCYAADALHTIAEIENKSDVLVGFTPKRIQLG